jgi:5-methylcytosine-specific restriction endonuclease McrA
MLCKTCTSKPRKPKSTLCSDCYREYQREWYKKKRSNNEDYLEKNRKRSKSYYKENKDKWRNYKRLYRKENLDLVRFWSRESSKRYRQNNPDYVLGQRAQNAKRRALGYITKETIKLVFTLYPRCVYCGSLENKTLEHVVPISKGGTNDFDNLATACSSCNSSKKGKTLLEFMVTSNG